MELTEKQIGNLKLNEKQLKAAKDVYKAIRAASKLGVHFWDNYGVLTAYNSKKIVTPIMNDYTMQLTDSLSLFKASTSPNDEVLYYENLRNFHAGNADDEFYARII